MEEKVYCSQCKWHSPAYNDSWSRHGECRSPKNVKIILASYEEPAHYELFAHWPEALNKDNNCSFFDKKKKWGFF